VATYKAKRKKKAAGEDATGGPSAKFTRWQARIAAARKAREDWARAYQVEQAERYYLGRRSEGDDAPFFELIEPTVRAKRPNLLFSAPRFYVRPKAGRLAPALERVAAAGEGALDAVATRERNLESQGRLAVTQALFRLGVLKVCYDPRLVPNPRAGQPIVETDDGGQPVIDPATQLPVAVTDPETGEPQVEPDEVVTDEVYAFKWVDAATMLLPDEGPDRTRWSWIGEEVTVTLGEAKADPRFKRHAEHLRSNVSSRKPGEAVKVQPSLEADPEDALFRYTEIYDACARERLILADDQAKDVEFLVEEPMPDWIERDPYALLALGEPIMGPEPSPWPKPVVKSWLVPQDEANTNRKLLTEGSKRGARKVWYNDNAFKDAEEAFKFLQSPDDMEGVEVQGKPGQDFGVFDVPSVNADVPKALLMIDQFWRVVTGQTGARLSDPDADTATEASFVERAAGVRDAEDQKLVEAWLGEGGQKMFRCLRATLTLDTWIKLRGASDGEVVEYLTRVVGLPPEVVQATPLVKALVRSRLGEAQWTRITRSDLDFDADVTVAPGSARPKNLDAERNAFLKVLSIIGQAPQLLMSRELTQRVLRYFEMEDPRLLDELQQLAQLMVQLNAKQAGREQGGASQGPAGPEGNGAMGGGLSAVLAGANAGSPA
jgi:hypothetical protein